MKPSAETYRDFLARGGVADLSDRVKLRLTGADRVRYLNGQATANVQNLRSGQTAPACVTTAKGRLCAEIVITAADDALYIDADATLREALPARLERYIVADDVVLTDVTEALRLIHFLPPAGAALEPVWPARFAHRCARRFGREGADFLLSAEDATALLAALLPAHVALDESFLETLRIEAGVPRWGRDIDEETLPPEAGLDRTHIDYHKGCYVGQEVISRLKSIGHVNRRLVGFIATTGESFIVGSTVVTASDLATPVGTITSAAWSFALEKPIALGYLRRTAPATGLLAPAPVAVQELPFTT
jgi:folate-binding protein YgfZ